MTGLPLEGMVVVTMEQAVAAPFATRHLADLGARVIKIERPDGDFAREYDHFVDGMATYFVWLNRGKESVVLDIHTELGMEALEKLIERADVFVQNLAPGAATRLGVEAHQLVERFPRLVACDVSGYGSQGPYAAKRAYDLVVQAEAASISITGTPDQRAKPGIAVADIAAGMYCFSTVLAALLARATTGEGTAIEVSLFDCMAEWMHYSLYYTMYTGREQLPYGIGHHQIVPYGAFVTRDEQFAVLGCQNDREWARLATDVLGRPDLAENPDYLGLPNRVARREEIHGLVGRAIGELDLEEASKKLDAAGIANGRLNSIADLLAHPQLSARERWQWVESPVGPVPAVLPPPIVSGWQLPMKPIPALGQHTAAVLAELGLDTKG